MKKKVFIILISILILFLVAIIAYLFLANIQSKIPTELKEKYAIQVSKYNNRNIFTIQPKQEKNNKYILYFHGGSYMAELTKAHWEFLDKIIQETGDSVIVPDYPLTPKYNYKDVFEMVVPMYKELIKIIEPENIIMMGDSAGGGLALALEEKLGEEAVALPDKLILLSPWIDVTMSNPEIDNIEKYDKDLNKEALKVAGITYSGLDGMDSYLVNPINGPMEKLKNVTIYTGTYDILNPDVKILEKRAKEKEINIDIKEYEGARHIWIVYQQDELAKQALQDLIKTIK